MLKIKTGVVIHADYEFSIITSAGTVKATYGFVNNELLPKGVESFGKANVYRNAEFGVSGAIVNEDQVSGSLMPIIRFPFNTQVTTNSFSEDIENKRIILTTTYDFSVSGFTIPSDGDLNIREFSIDGLSRVVLKDNFQNIPDGLIIGTGESIQVKVKFTFTYYTNNKTDTVGSDIFGTQVDYTSEVMVLPDTYPMAIRNATGYANAGVMEILPITTDIRGVSANKIAIPKRDEFQQVGSKVDTNEHRVDMVVVGYRPQKTNIYGFILKDLIRGVGVLVRFLDPVTIEREKRYEVGGYIKWGRIYDSMDDGFNILDMGIMNESIPLTAGIMEYNLQRPLITPEAASQLTGLTGLRFDIDDEVIIIPSNTPMPTIVSTLKQYGIDVTLLSNRPVNRTPSTLEYFSPEATAHQVLLELARTTVFGERQDWLFPVLVVGGDYIDTTPGQNSWRWDCYFPYMGQEQLYVGYTYGGFEKAKTEIKGVSTYANQSIVSTSVKENNSSVPAVTTTTDAATLLNTGIATTRGLAYARLSKIDGVVDPSIVTRGFKSTHVSDFDTDTYSEWVSGKTEITLNYRFLDLTTNVPSDTSRNVTEFRIVYDSAVHDATNTDLWVGGNKLGSLSTLDIDAFADSHGLRVVKSTVGTKTTYLFTRPFTTEFPQSIDLFFLGNEKIAFSANETGYLKILQGSQGYRVYNKSGSEITSSLYLEDNAFLLAGIRLYQPLPEYMYKYRILSLQEAAMYYNGGGISAVLSSNLFTVDFKDNAYSLTYQNSIDSKDPNLNTHSVYPAIGIDLLKIDAIIDDTVSLFVDPTGKVWTKGELFDLRLTKPEMIIDNTVYFVYPVKIQEGAQVVSKRISSEFYNQSIDLNINIEATLSYTLVSAVIQPDPTTLFVGESMPLTYTYEPTEARITSAAWASLDPLTATVSSNGTVTAVTSGQTTVRLTLNNTVIATAQINVLDPDIVIGCDGAPNISTCLTLEGNNFSLSVNDQDISTTITDEASREYFRDNDSFRIVNCTNYTKPTSTTIQETAFMSLEGEYDLFINGTLIGKDMNVTDIIAELDADERLVVIKGDS